MTTRVALESEETRLRTLVNGQLEARNENLSFGSTSYLRGDVNLVGSWRFLNFGAMTHLDNQEKPDRQPQNRFSVYTETSFLRLRYGDAYPVFPSLIASGKRVRGFTGGLALGFFNLDVSLGQTVRRIEGTLDSTRALTQSEIDTRPKTSRLLQDSTYEFFSTGTFTRDFVAVRPSFGSGENFQLGFTWLKAKDDVGSIRYGYPAQENVVAGTDLLLAFDNQRFKWESQASLSLQNTDITDGGFTDADYDSLEAQNPELGEQLKKIRPLAEKIITLNENLFPTNPVGTGLPGVSFESGLTLNYLNNYIQASFFRRGAAYRSFGNDFLQTDIQGFYVSDRIRMFNNRVFLTVSYEKKSDNTADTKEATTSFANLSTSLTVTPLGYPTFTVGYGFNDRISDLDVARPLLPDSLKDLPSAE
ncbi:MAG: hypothetical protein WD295_01155, partial [Bacteroidota bacterium]